MARTLLTVALLALLANPSAQAQTIIGGGASASQGCGSHCLMAVNGDSYAAGTFIDWKAGRVVTTTDAAQDAVTVWRGTHSIGMDAVADELSVPDSADWAAAGDFCESVWVYASPPATGTGTIWQQAGARTVGAFAGGWAQQAAQLDSETRIYSLAVLDGEIYGGTGSGGRLFRWNGSDAWTQVAAQLDSETRIYSLAVLDGEIYGGTYPGGRLFRWNGSDAWTQVAAQLDSQQYIYSLAVLDGEIYGGTDSGGRLFGYYPAGTVTATYTLADASTASLHGGVLTGAAWQQVEVCRSGGTLYLYVDGVLEDTATAAGALANAAAPLTLGAAGTTLVGSYDEWVMTSGGWAWTRTHSPGRCVGRRC
jgi:hypothetical protein